MTLINQNAQPLPSTYHPPNSLHANGVLQPHVRSFAFLDCDRPDARASEDFQRLGIRTFEVNTYRQGGITWQDARVLVHKTPWVYTTPNCDAIPWFDPNPCDLRARRDARFGLEDYGAHPQGYSEAYPWTPLIPKMPGETNALRAHRLALCWFDLHREHWVAPPRCGFTGVGTLHLQVYTEMFVVAVEVNTRAISFFHSASVPPEMVSTARAMFTTLERLKSLPMSWRDTNLQWTQLQHLVLDLAAQESYYGHYRSAMLQRTKVQKLNDNVLGCFSTNPAVVENMYWAGIPIYYVRQADHPNTWHIPTLRVHLDFAKATFIPLSEWHDLAGREQPCRTLWLASHGSDHIRMSRPFGRYFEDIPALPSAPTLQVGFTFPIAPPAAAPPMPHGDDPMPDVVYSSASPGPDHEMDDVTYNRTPSPHSASASTQAESSRSVSATAVPSARVATAPIIFEGGVRKLSRSQKKKQVNGMHPQFIIFKLG